MKPNAIFTIIFLVTMVNAWPFEEWEKGLRSYLKSHVDPWHNEGYSNEAVVKQLYDHLTKNYGNRDWYVLAYKILSGDKARPMYCGGYAPTNIGRKLIVASVDKNSPHINMTQVRNVFKNVPTKRSKKDWLGRRKYIGDRAARDIFHDLRAKFGGSPCTFGVIHRDAKPIQKAPRERLVTGTKGNFLLFAFE